MADPTLVVRAIAREHKDSPRNVIIPKLGDVYNSIRNWMLTDNREKTTLYTLANSFFDSDTESTLTIETFHLARDLLDTYVVLTQDDEPYYLAIAERFIGVGEDSDTVAEVLKEYYNEEGKIRSRINNGAELERLIFNNNRARDEANISNNEYYRDRIIEVLSAYNKTDTVDNIRIVTNKINVIYKVEYRIGEDTYPLSHTILESLIRAIILNERLYYAAYRVSNDKLIRQIREGVTLKETLPIPLGKEELLLVIATPGRNDRIIRLDVRQSLLYMEDESYLPIVLTALPDLVVISTESNLKTVSISYPIISLIPNILYYIIRTKEPWKSLMGVDDSQYDRKGVRNLIARVKRWIIPDVNNLDSELLVTLYSSYGTNIPIEGEVQEGITFEVRDVDDVALERVVELSSRLINDYNRYNNDIVKVYNKTFPSLLTPLVSKGISKSKQLELLQPDIFDSNYAARCNHRPSLASPDEEDAVEFGDLTLKCPNRYKLELLEGDPIIPCCIPIVKRAIINMETQMEQGKEGYLRGIASIFGKLEKAKKGSSNIVRVGEGKNLRSVITKIIGKDLKRIIDNVVIAPFFQSMWDMKENDMRDYINNENIIWDSDKIIDGLALNLSINIFVVEYENDMLLLRMPRHRFAYYLPFCYDRESIFLYRHKIGNGIYEGIRTTDTRNYRQSIEITRRAIQWFQDQHRIELLDRDGTYNSLQDRGPYKEEEMRTNNTQIIDVYGKLRGYQDNTGLIKYYSHPSAPLLGPYTRKPDEKKNRESYTNIRKTENVQIEKEEWKNIPISSSLVALPVSRVWEDGSITGLSWREDTPSTYSLLSRDRSYILQLINWMYSNARQEGISLNAFLSLLEEDNTISYNFSTVPEELGNSTLLDASKYLVETGLTRVIDENISIMCNSIGIKRGIIQMLKVAEFTHGNSPPIPERLINVDYDKEHSYVDSTGIVNKQIFLHNDGAYQSWRNSIRQEGQLNLSSPYVRLLKSPFTIVSSSRVSNRVDRWIVQNVANGSYTRAIQCCAIWLQDRKNSGFFTEQVPDPYDSWKDKVVVYTWDETRLLIPNVVVEGRIITILVYPGYKIEGVNSYKGYFAALLPLISS